MKALFTSLSVLIFSLSLNAQLFVDNSISPEQMVMDFFDNSCVTPSNITFTGLDVSHAYFEAATTDYGINAGILLSTGDVNNIAYPPNDFFGFSLDAPGDDDLLALSGGTASFNAAVLEFDITAQESGLLEFNYIFASEEYPEFVNAGFNDVFAFFVRHQDSTAYQNIAMIPGQSTPVSIDNVNDVTNADYYIDYAATGGSDIVFDGRTILLPASFSVEAGNTYHIKIGITDIGDAIYDSGIFIATNSLCGEELVEPTGEINLMVDGNTITFDNQVRYGTSWTWNLGDGTVVTDRYPAPHTYAAAGEYIVELVTENFCCADTTTFNVSVGLNSLKEVNVPEINISPNPATDWVQIDLQETAAPKTVRLKLLNLQGQELLQQRINGSGIIDLSALKAGIYLLQLETEQTTITQKLLKQ